MIFHSVDPIAHVPPDAVISKLLPPLGPPRTANSVESNAMLGAEGVDGSAVEVVPLTGLEVTVL